MINANFTLVILEVASLFKSSMLQVSLVIIDLDQKHNFKSKSRCKTDVHRFRIKIQKDANVTLILSTIICIIHCIVLNEVVSTQL